MKRFLLFAWVLGVVAVTTVMCVREYVRGRVNNPTNMNYLNHLNLLNLLNAVPIFMFLS